MGAAKGNKNGRGNSNSGRKSMYQEKADATFLADMFFKEYTKEELEQMLSGKRSISKQMLVKAIGGNEKYSLAIFNKLFPDLSKSESKIDIKGKVEVTEDVKKFAAELSKKLEDADK